MLPERFPVDQHLQQGMLVFKTKLIIAIKLIII